MSYQIYDEKGYVGDLCSNNGLNELIAAAKNSPALSPLFKDGSIELDDAVKKSISEIDVPALDNLKELIAKCGEVAIITDGTF